MPRICAFYGILIQMHWERGERHHLPHFHALYGEFEVSVGIDPPAVLAGSMPPKALGLIFEWTAAHVVELLENWERALERRSLVAIPPLA